MPESFHFQFENLEEKKEPVLPEENLDLAELQESMELIELRRGFANELRKPHEGSYYKKLQRIAAAIALAGLATFAAPEKAISPEKSQELKQFEQMDYYSTRDMERYKEILDVLEKSSKEKGGISSSPQLPEEIYKPERLAEFVYEITKEEAWGNGKTDRPYFSKPEIIFGEEFIKKNPEKAREYFERISKTQKATVFIKGDKGQGSGAIINTEKGKIILTNYHVIRDQKNLLVEFFNGLGGGGGNIKVLSEDKENDLAIMQFDFSDEVLEGVNSLDIDTNPYLPAGAKIAAVGHAMGYPFEVSLGKVEGIGKIGVKSERTGQKLIIFKPDERFAKLALYEVPREIKGLTLAAHRGEIIWGMSGGPEIKLDDMGEPKLVGLNVVRVDDQRSSYFASSGGITSDTIKKFLEKSDYPASSSGISSGGITRN